MTAFRHWRHDSGAGAASPVAANTVRTMGEREVSLPTSDSVSYRRSSAIPAADSLRLVVRSMRFALPRVAACTAPCVFSFHSGENYNAMEIRMPRCGRRENLRQLSPTDLCSFLRRRARVQQRRAEWIYLRRIIASWKPLRFDSASFETIERIGRSVPYRPLSAPRAVNSSSFAIQRAIHSRDSSMEVSCSPSTHHLWRCRIEHSWRTIARFW